MWKIGLALIVLIGAFGGGYYYGSGNVITNTVTVKGDTVTQTVDHVVTQIVEKKPDGTVTTTTKTEEVAAHTETKESQTATQTVPASVGASYKVGAEYWANSVNSLGDWNRPDNYSVYLSRRMVGPLWGDVQVRPTGSQKSVALGLSVEW